MRVALFRARDDTERTAERLRAMGHDPVLAPVIEIAATGLPLPTGPFDAVIFASAHAVEAVTSEPTLCEMPAFCVGARTAARANFAGLSVAAADEDAAKLVRSVRSRLHRPARLLLVAGRHRKPVIEAELAAAGHEVAVLEAYEARAVERWDAAVSGALRRSPIEAALHYSRRSADLAHRCARESGLADAFRSAAHVCLSEDVASALRDAGLERISVAERPTEDSLLSCLATFNGPAPLSLVDRGRG